VKNINKENVEILLFLQNDVLEKTCPAEELTMK
jgi:hypothetical protein